MVNKYLEKELEIAKKYNDKEKIELLNLRIERNERINKACDIVITACYLILGMMMLYAFYNIFLLIKNIDAKLTVVSITALIIAFWFFRSATR